MIALHNRALLAPMSGITDLPFRRLAHRFGAGLVVGEMVDVRLLAAGHRQTLRRVAGGDEIRPYVIQISGRDPREMADAARMAADFGADMVDINMGCPARKVTKGLAGSALMREPELAIRIVEAVVTAMKVPVSLKMRLGWDVQSLNAACIARKAQDAGISMFVVHGRTRNQFYEGMADWAAIREVVGAVKVPVFANGDIVTPGDAVNCLERSGAHGVMIGRGALGRPWFVGQVGALLDKRLVPEVPGLAETRLLVIGHYEDMLAHYGSELGMRIARKHLGWYVDGLMPDAGESRFWRSQLCRETSHRRVLDRIEGLFDHLENRYRLAS